MIAKTLEDIAKSYRREILDLGLETNIPHIAPSFSTVEIIVALYEDLMTENDKFILSKGHGCLGYYIALRRKGFEPQIKYHPDIEVAQGIECTSGSLGHGLPVGVGMAFAKKYILQEEGNVYVLMGDGECQEGTIWESLLIASYHKLNNLVIVIDHNKIQSLGRVGDTLSFGNFKSKFASLGCFVLELDGHDIAALQRGLRVDGENKPKVIIAHTVKGKGFSIAENNPEWHHRLPVGKELVLAEEELR